MKKTLLVMLGLAVLGCVEKSTTTVDKVAELKEKHQNFLKNSPFKETMQMSKEERKSIGLPPNKFNEREWELTMNPALGHPEPYKVDQLREQLAELDAQRAPGDGTDADWIERGPNNIGGRTRAVLFDPNDGTNRRVFAGAVSGGLWVNNDITSNNSWTRVAGVPGNLNVSSITVDPNNSNTWYLSTGESYTFGQAVGNGVWKSTDGGANWTQVLSVDAFSTSQTGATFEVIGGLHYINDIIAWDNNGTTEVHIAAGTHIYGDADNPTNYLGVFDTGVYMSSNGGTTWAKDVTVTKSGCDLEIDAAGNLWVTTTNSTGLGDQGGDIYRKNNGTSTFSLVRTIPGVNRTELEPSGTNANKFYVLCQSSTPGGAPTLYLTTNAFASAPSNLSLPNDPDGSVQASDFTRGQSFYDLVVEADPTNDAIVYLGGINVHRSANSGSSWNTISHWSTAYSTAGSLVHADQHALVFRPGNSNQAVLGHDGGVSYASSLSATGNSLTAITDRITDYNVTQFYDMGVAPTAFAAGDHMLAGAQDNGTPYVGGANPTGPDSFTDISGGDGAYSFYDQILGLGSGYLITNYVYNNSIRLYDFGAGAWRTINSENGSNGDFINVEELDSNLDILYSNYTAGATYRIRRYSNLLGTVGKTLLTNGLLDAAPTKMKASPYTTGSTTLMVGTANGKVLRVTNANIAPFWSDITAPGMVGSVSDIEFGQNENEIFVTFHNYAVSSIWYTTNGGATWSEKEGNLPDMPVKTILQNPLNTNEVIVGTELGVWYTQDFSNASPSWSRSQNGMQDVKVTSLELRDDNAVFASTYGRGVFSGQFTDVALNISDEELEANSLVVYPTVSSGNISIKSTKNFSDVVISVYGMSGQQVSSHSIQRLNSNQENGLNLTSLNAGVYFVNIKAEGLNKTEKIIIR